MTDNQDHFLIVEQISEALPLPPGSIVSVVGGGGKTSLCIQLCQELFERGTSTIFTTTTRIEPPDEMELLLSKSSGEIESFIQRHHKPYFLALGLELSRDGKVLGLPSEWVMAMPKWDPSAVVVVEADGSRGLPLKAPAAHEPVIPADSGMVVVVAGVDIVGMDLVDGNVHRPEIIAEILGKGIGSAIEIEDVARLLSHPLGGLKSIPDQAGVVFFLNKADHEDEWEKASAIAQGLKRRSPQAKVIIGSVKRKRFALYLIA